MKSKAKPTISANLVSCRVTATDRNGVPWQSETVSSSSPSEIIKLRAALFHKFRNKWPDCQVYFDWSYDNKG